MINCFMLTFQLLQVSARCDKWEDVNMICPHHCVCQYAHRMDLSIARWIQAVETRQRKGHEFIDASDDTANNNEVKLWKIIFRKIHQQALLLRRSSTMTFYRKTMSCLNSRCACCHRTSSRKTWLRPCPTMSRLWCYCRRRIGRTYRVIASSRSLSQCSFVIYSFGQRLQSTFRPEDARGARFEGDALNAFLWWTAFMGPSS